MKAVVIHGENEFQYKEVPVEKPEENEVLIKIRAGGLCGTDYELYTNEMIYIKQGLAVLPMIPGHEWSGTVEQVGAKVNKYRVGDRVTGECTVWCGECLMCQKGKLDQCTNRTETGVMNRDGGFAEYITFPASHLHNIKNIPFDEAALIEPTAIALHGVIRSGLTALDNVLISGPGPIGLMAAQLAKKVFNAKRVILSGTREERLATGLSFGIDGTINVRNENIQQKVYELTNGEGIDVVVECSGGATVFKDIEKVINPGGRVLLMGFFGNKTANIDWDAFTTKGVTIIGCLGSPVIWDDVIDLMERKVISTKPLITHYMKLSEFDKALDYMVNRKENACKIILEP